MPRYSSCCRQAEAPLTLPCPPAWFCLSVLQFMAGPENRSRYWARSFAGWLKFGSVQPNAAHESIARLQQGGACWQLPAARLLPPASPPLRPSSLAAQPGRPGLACPTPAHACPRLPRMLAPLHFSAGWGQGLITQNVDRLHHKAGSADILELHGTTHQVVCMGCGRLSCRHELQRTLADLNPDAAAAAQQLAAQQDARDDRERLLRAGTAAPVHPSLRVRRGGGGVEGMGVAWGAPGGGGRAHAHLPWCPHNIAGALPNIQQQMIPPPCLVQETGSSSSSSSRSSSSSSSSGMSAVGRPDGDAQPDVRRPDGDMEVADGGRGFRVPPCSACGGVLKPHVVFFGDGEAPPHVHVCMCAPASPACGWENGHVLLGQHAAAPLALLLPLPLPPPLQASRRSGRSVRWSWRKAARAFWWWEARWLCGLLSGWPRLLWTMAPSWPS